MPKIAELPGASPPGPLKWALDPTPQNCTRALNGDAFDSTLSVNTYNHPLAPTLFFIRIYAMFTPFSI